MKLRLTFDVSVDEAGLARYYETYPDLADFDGNAADTLIREAIAQWESESLVETAKIIQVWKVTMDERGWPQLARIDS